VSKANTIFRPQLKFFIVSNYGIIIRLWSKVAETYYSVFRTVVFIGLSACLRLYEVIPPLPKPDILSIYVSLEPICLFTGKIQMSIFRIWAYYPNNLKLLVTSVCQL
jgi:hypothetical protein